MTDTELAVWLEKEIERVKRGIERYAEGMKSDDPEYRSGSKVFFDKYTRDLRVYELALAALHAGERQ